ncbi:aminotransferase [Parahaliea aestuarii]|uniref:Aminotransferase n=1 Tax=Parahaliea aestuarii TaxID=1852021 RepID=A0A5C8ZWI6_9GAMM|nr:aminotransferase [Parahaliea aestuarii]
MQPTPDGWPRIAPALYYEDPRAAIQWLCDAFGFEVRLLVESPEGGIMHSELVYGDGVIMVGDAGKGPRTLSPGVAGGNTQSIMIHVDDVDAHCQRARQFGAVIETEPMETDYGPEYWTDRAYGARDPEGHPFWIVQRLRTGHPRWSEVRNKVDQHH